MAIVKIICDVCFELIGMADLDTLTMPMMGAMFTSHDEKHGYPPPFHPDVEWEAMRCPYGPHRPFIREDAITFIGENGPEVYVLPVSRPNVEAQDESLEPGASNPTGETGDINQQASPLSCPTCGKVCKNRISLEGHKRSHR